jgi:hypothetical protein
MKLPMWKIAKICLTFGISVLLFVSCENKPIEEYYSNGMIKTKTVSINSGRKIKYSFYENGNIKSQTTFKEGKKDGPELIYDQDSKLSKIIFQRNNSAEGSAYKFYDDGSIENIVNYKNGQIDGSSIYYYQNGKILGISDLRNGKEVAWKSYTKSGILKKSSPFVEISEIPDTLTLGKRYSLRIQLMFPVPFFDIKYVLKEEKNNGIKREINKELKLVNNETSYSFIPENSGKYSITGFARQTFHPADKPDSALYPFTFPFEKEFTVLGSK